MIKPSKQHSKQRCKRSTSFNRQVRPGRAVYDLAVAGGGSSR
jgi:hypothetical protein